MPCERCNIQFTVFKRKRSCYDCKRYYCHNCCYSSSNNRKYALCERCLLFNKRPLVHSDLVKLKPKDLIFYLQSKHISTAGCVEKEELIDLVLQYVNRTDISNQLITGGSSSASSSGNSSHQTTPQHQNNSAKTIGDVGVGDAARSSGYGATGNNSFDSIKQTCQNFFSSLGDNISDSLANLESRACAKNRPSTNVTIPANVTEQPRVATRVIRAYASSQQNSPESPIMDWTPCASSSLNTVNLLVDLPPPTEETEVYKNSKDQEECECSEDEEIFASFNGRIRSPNSELEAQNLPINRDEYIYFNGNNKSLNINAFNDCVPSTSMSSSKAFLQNSKLEIYANDEESSHSSFEELGAIGGISDDSKTNTDTTSNTTDHWQILDLKINETETAPVALRAQQQQHPYEQDIDKSNSMCLNNLTTQNMESCTESSMNAQEQVNHPPPTPSHIHPTAVKNFTRRRSESYITTTRFQPCANGEDGDVKRMLENTCIEEKYEMPSSSSTRIQDQTKRCCTRCGKNKANIRQQVEKMRQHLESSQMSETDIKQELSEFLTYLEQRTKSIEYSDSEAGVSIASVSRNTNEVEEEGASVEHLLEEQILRGQTLNRWTNLCDSNVNKSDGTTSNFIDKDSRFINIDEIESTKQLEGLTVKQLKEVLMLNRVDYKGCCEKQELLDRVERLWKNLKSTPAVEKLPTDELCKICMDAPIECVILECGHMATCTNCGKVLSECPICRQYIVRVVRFFRA